MEVPEEAVLVVANRGNGRDHKAPRAGAVDSPGVVVGVFPEQVVVLLVDADGVRNRQRLAGPGIRDTVEVGDLAEAVAPEPERVGQGAEAVLADVEDVLEVGGRAGVTVRDHELCDRGSVADRAALSRIRVADVVEGQPLPGVKPDPEIPLLPGQVMTLEGEARTLRLRDLDRTQVGAVRATATVDVACALAARRARAVTDIVDPDDFLLE